MDSIYVLILLLGATVIFGRYKRPRLSLPPGPKPLPIIKNLFQFPSKEPAKVFAKWKERYGDLIYIHDLGGPTLVINSQKANKDLLDRRSAIYSDRPAAIMCDELTGLQDWQFSMMPYSDSWRSHRRLFHQFFNENASKNYLKVQERCVDLFLQQLLAEPNQLLEHIRMLFANTILRITYDIEVEQRDNKYVELAEKTIKVSADSLDPFTYAVNMLPFLKYIPSWFPGVEFHKAAAEAKILSHDMRELPFQHVKRKMDLGSGTSILQSMIEKLEENKDGKNPDQIQSDIETAKNCAAVAYLGGADTTLSSIQMLFVALANNPDVQKRAQAEIDANMGSGRLPRFEDLQDLPYINAIAKELLRWHNVVPFGIAHRLTQDDEYQGYHIPKGTRVFMNVWGILHDPEVYPDPLAFNPSRWLIDTPSGPKINPDIPDPDIAVFGAGRRICPGRYLAENAILIVISNVLACFNISPLDNAGNPVEKISEETTEGLLIYPKPFKVTVTPRSEKVVDMINETKI